MSENLRKAALLERNKQELHKDLSRPNLATLGGIGHNRGPPLDAKYVDVRGAAEILTVSASFLNKLRMSGGGPKFLKLGFHVRYHIPTLLEWAAAQTRRSTSDPGEAA